MHVLFELLSKFPVVGNHRLINVCRFCHDCLFLAPMLYHVKGRSNLAAFIYHQRQAPHSHGNEYFVELNKICFWAWLILLVVARHLMIPPNAFSRKAVWHTHSTWKSQESIEYHCYQWVPNQLCLFELRMYCHLDNKIDKVIKKQFKVFHLIPIMVFIIKTIQLYISRWFQVVNNFF